eukprot:g3863.t1
MADSTYSYTSHSSVVAPATEVPPGQTFSLQQYGITVDKPLFEYDFGVERATLKLAQDTERKKLESEEREKVLRAQAEKEEEERLARRERELSAERNRQAKEEEARQEREMREAEARMLAEAREKQLAEEEERKRQEEQRKRERAQQQSDIAKSDAQASAIAQFQQITQLSESESKNYLEAYSYSLSAATNAFLQGQR